MIKQIQSILFIHRFGGFDSFDVRAVRAVVDIRMCDCNMNGECTFENIQTGQTFNESFKIVECNCTDGWLGQILFLIDNYLVMDTA